MLVKFSWKGLYMAIFLLLLAAGSVTVAWTLTHPQNETPHLPYTDTVFQSSDTQKMTESGTLETLTDPEYTDVSVTETETQTETVTQTTTDSESEQTDTYVEPQIPLGQILGQITPPPEGSPKKIAFTFDDGPYAPVTRGIAEEFSKYGGKCTFFVVGNRIKGDWETAMKYASDLGHEIAIHGYTHTVYYNRCSYDTYLYEVQTTAARTEQVTGKAPAVKRPSGGSITNSRVAESPYSIIMWNVDTKDWQYSGRNEQNVNRIVQNIVSSATVGDIVLMHDIYYNTLDVVKIILPALAEQGYEFVTVSELLGEERQAGKKYSNAY